MSPQDDGTRQRLHGLALRIVGCPSLADEVVQEALIAYWQVEEAPEHPRAWLSGVVVKRALHHLRAIARRRAHECADPPCCVLNEDPSQHLERAELRERVLDAIEQLPTRLRDPLELYELEGLDYRAIGSRLGVPIGTVRSRISRARSRLRRRLENTV